MGADAALEVVHEGVHLFVGRSPVEVAALVGDESVQGSEH
jgi:hypothetical protein